jgi:NitT/TauT family transport system substrate-binding protein
MFGPNAAPRHVSGGVVGALVALTIAAGCGGVSSTAASPSPGQKTAIQVSYSEVIPDEWAPWAAEDGGIYAKHGLDVTLQSIASANGIAALLSGQVQVAQLGGSEVLSADASGGDIVIVADLVPVFPYVFITAPSVASIADLKGKKVGVSKVGGSADIATRVALKANGLDPAKDVSIIETGSAANRVAALRSGAIQGGVSQPPESTTLEAQGFHSVYDMAKQKLPAANTVVAVTGTYLRANKQVVQNYVDALVESIARLKKDRAFAEQVLTHWEKVTDKTLLDSTYAFYTQEVFATYPQPSKAQYTATVQALTTTNPKLASFPVSKALNTAFVQSAMSRKVGG